MPRFKLLKRKKAKAKTRVQGRSASLDYLQQQTGVGGGEAGGPRGVNGRISASVGCLDDREEEEALPPTFTEDDIGSVPVLPRTADVPPSPFPHAA
ncbi:hypothetical protein ACOMHN_002624 [Nucella lapillus]